MINVTAIPAFSDNYIWMISDNSTHIWVVDPGDAQPVIHTLKKNFLTLAGILLTHHHKDHSGGIEDLIDFAGNIPVYASALSPVKHVSERFKEGDVIKCNSMKFSVIEIPGHTLDHIAFYGHGTLFCGDTLFSAGCGKIFEGTAEQMFHSLQKIFRLDNNTKLYCGHEYTASNLLFANHVMPGNKYVKNKMESVSILRKNNKITLPSTLAEEKLINPFLRCNDLALINNLEKYAGKSFTNPIEIFSHLREWKNNFK